MLRLTFCALLGILLLSGAATARTDQPTEIPSVTVLADSRLAVPLAQLISRFARESMISVSAAFGHSAEQKKKIEDGEPADLFITSDPELVKQLKLKGLTDVHTIGEIASQGSVHYTAAVVAGENMDPAREFLHYLKSEEAKQIFAHNGLRAP